MKRRFVPFLGFARTIVSFALIAGSGCARVDVETVEPPEAGFEDAKDDGSRINACTDCPECLTQRMACLELPLCRASSDCATARNCYSLPLREFFDCATQCAIEVGITTFDDPAAPVGYAHYQCLLNSSCRQACIGDQ